ncbi:ATP-grasp domain-containing protein [Oceanobacillus oncorhynchi subsp. oncorhynchi]|uniref:ATP-grasp domain-containing protein n=1 Tax=Oceanobacillus oncorhynchi TaxID=545501 RepID=UPI0031E123AC
MNILISSAGRRVKVVQYFKENLNEVNGKVIAVDCDIKAPALYFADEKDIIPRVDNEYYLEKLLNICKKYKVDAILSLIDPELEILAANKKVFDELNIKLILSSLEMLAIGYDKQATYEYLFEKGIPCVPTFNKVEIVERKIEQRLLEFPFIVKPQRGSASIGIEIANDLEELKKLFAKEDNLIIQPFYKDKEFGVDVYVDLIDGHLVDFFIKEKISMRSGETDKSIAIHNREISSLIRDFVVETNFRGQIDIDCFEYEGQYYISEINPRFGGGYPHAYEAGVNFMKYIIENLNDRVNKKYTSYNYEAGNIMMKYDNVKLI